MAKKTYQDFDGQHGEEVAVFSVDMQKVMMPLLPGVITCVFTRRLAVFHETFAPLGGRASENNKDPVGVVWHEGITGRHAEDVMNAYDKVIQHRM